MAVFLLEGRIHEERQADFCRKEASSPGFCRLLIGVEMQFIKYVKRKRGHHLHARLPLNKRILTPITN